MATSIASADDSAAIVANIKALEGLLDEFFRDVSNERKSEIERMLTEFGDQVMELSFPYFYSYLLEKEIKNPGERGYDAPILALSTFCLFTEFKLARQPGISKSKQQSLCINVFIDNDRGKYEVRVAFL